MYRDNTLIPTEAVRLLALALLASGEKTYAQLAAEVRHFTGRIVGPSLDLVGAPLEVLKVEGLIELKDRRHPQVVSPDEDLLRITDTGRVELRRLLSSNVRPPVDGLNRLIIAVKIRFLHLLKAEEQRTQAEILGEMCERELARLTDLRAFHSGEAGHFVEWLDQEIKWARGRMQWFHDLRSKLV